MAFSPRKTAEDTNKAPRMRVIVLTQAIVSWFLLNRFWKVRYDAKAQKKNEKGRTRLDRTAEYLRVPMLTTPQKKRKS